MTAKWQLDIDLLIHWNFTATYLLISDVWAILDSKFVKAILLNDTKSISNKRQRVIQDKYTEKITEIIYLNLSNEETNQETLSYMHIRVQINLVTMLVFEAVLSSPGRNTKHDFYCAKFGHTLNIPYKLYQYKSRDLTVQLY